MHHVARCSFRNSRVTDQTICTRGEDIVHGSKSLQQFSRFIHSYGRNSQSKQRTPAFQLRARTNGIEQRRGRGSANSRQCADLTQPQPIELAGVPRQAARYEEPDQLLVDGNIHRG